MAYYSFLAQGGAGVNFSSSEPNNGGKVDGERKKGEDDDLPPQRERKREGKFQPVSRKTGCCIHHMRGAACGGGKAVADSCNVRREREKREEEKSPSILQVNSAPNLALFEKETQDQKGGVDFQTVSFPWGNRGGWRPRLRGKTHFQPRVREEKGSGVAKKNENSKKL